MTDKLNLKIIEWTASGYGIKRSLERNQGNFATKIVESIHQVQESRRGLNSLWRPQSDLFQRNRNSLKRSHRYYKATQRLSKAELEGMLANVNLMEKYFKDCADLSQ